ncbi:MAG: hypothetical protein ACI4PF_07095 [Christensenellales bacterium]
MKNKKLKSILCAVAVIATMPLGLTACKEKGKSIDVNAKDVYALSAVSSVNYLKNLETEPSVQGMSINATNSDTRPTNISDTDVEGMKNCLSMFDSIIQSGDVNHSTTKNTDVDKANYNFVMTITLPGTNENIKMYYNEIETETSREIDDEDEEVKVSTSLSGIMILGDSEFEVEGEREFETEGDETEASIEFTTRSKVNSGNYITIQQSVENEDGEYEIEYEYKIYENGKLVQETETEIESEDNKIELEFKLKENGVPGKTVYKITKGTSPNTFVIKYIINNVSDTINVIKVTDGYKFTYSNGFEESI